MNEQKKYRKPTRLPALMLSAALGLSTAAYADNYDVTAATDDGTGNTPDTLSWAVRQANSNPNADTVTLRTDVTVTGVMKTLIDGAPGGGDHDNGGGDLTIQSNGPRRSISGGGQFRPLFVKSGSVTIRNLDLENGRADGGNSRRGGGGAGLGGALFVYSGDVTVENAAFNNNSAVGGSGAFHGLEDNGGGGMFGNGGGFGGGGLFEDSAGNAGGYGGCGRYGGFGGGSYSGNGGFGGGGGFGGYDRFSGGNGGGGGFGGGGGYGWYGNGGNGGFGGGGGSGHFGDSGNGGFGGGGGYSDFGRSGRGGFGGGGGYGSGSGGGAGFGGAIFAMNGTVTLTDVRFSGNSVTGGSGYENGSVEGADVFICDGTDHDPLCGATVNACGTTTSSEIAGVFGTDCPGSTTPEIDITGNGVSITDGDSTPESGDHTDFGGIAVGALISRIYTVVNSGDANLNLTVPVALDGQGCTEFTVTVQPSSSAAPGGMTAFIVEYSPTDEGEDICTVSINNNDSDENPYTFDIKGAGVIVTDEKQSWLPAVCQLLL